MEDKTYVPLYGFVIPAYLYIEGEEKERYWVDSQNIDYYLYNKNIIDDNKNWWMICPYKPEGVTITAENQEELVKWCVYDTSVDDDEDKKWDFETHKPININ